MFCPLVSLFMLLLRLLLWGRQYTACRVSEVSSALRESYRFAHSTDVGTGLKYGVDGEYVWHRAWRKQPFEKLRDYDQDLFAVRSSANLKGPNSKRILAEVFLKYYVICDRLGTFKVSHEGFKHTSYRLWNASFNDIFKNIGYIKKNCTLLNVSKIVIFFFSLSFRFRCVLLFRSPRFKQQVWGKCGEIHRIHFYSSLRTFIRDNV